jgi:hypothetical protein
VFQVGVLLHVVVKVKAARTTSTCLQHARRFELWQLVKVLVRRQRTEVAGPSCRLRKER